MVAYGPFPGGAAPRHPGLRLKDLPNEASQKDERAISYFYMNSSRRQPNHTDGPQPRFTGGAGRAGEGEGRSGSYCTPPFGLRMDSFLA
jgi:hypothetical protein